ncbi:hypothetical protein [Streptomyces sp. NRRL B-1322]|uniref:hypothetical protein n=1 Tax=Streptomyces sp. NRRL B-1322 TaxID=1463828 RepID=UPI000AF7A7FF|nr:hypothetical protein [Streptomyces sp. NRRL B-1322]
MSLTKKLVLSVTTGALVTGGVVATMAAGNAAGPSGSCVLLNNAAFDKVREPGKNLIRRARIERVGGGNAPATGAAPAKPAAPAAPAAPSAAPGGQAPPAGPSGSCVLLNNAAFDKVREPGKNLIRRARIERVN